MFSSLFSDRLLSLTAYEIIKIVTGSLKNTHEHPQSLPIDLLVKLVQQGRVFIQNHWFVVFPPFVFCILFGIIKQI